MCRDRLQECEDWRGESEMVWVSVVGGDEGWGGGHEDCDFANACSDVASSLLLDLWDDASAEIAQVSYLVSCWSSV